MKAIIFDAGNTLVWLDHPFLVQLLREQGVEATEEEIAAAEYGAKRVLDEQVRSGAAGTDESRGRVFFREIFRQVGLADDRFGPVSERLYARHAERNLWSSVRERTAETLEELRRRGYRLGVISNADGRVEALLESVGLRPHFEFVIDSARVGMEKPDPRIFRMGLERLGVAPEDAVYVGDIYEIDVVGARRAGMAAVLIDPLGRWTELDCDRVAGIHELPAWLDGAA
ncbi:MAG TPA: HAD-IA family hydrolase [Longimicrobiaceae bacterium]|nr:HAD-IA family hydrolase [Longimicrobiaceae bacterium]